MFGNHLVAFEMPPAIKNPSFWPSRIGFRVLSVSQMDDCESFGTVKNPEKYIVAILTSANRRYWNSKKSMLRTKFAAQFLLEAMTGRSINWMPRNQPLHSAPDLA